VCVLCCVVFLIFVYFTLLIFALIAYNYITLCSRPDFFLIVSFIIMFYYYGENVRHHAGCQYHIVSNYIAEVNLALIRI